MLARGVVEGMLRGAEPPPPPLLKFPFNLGLSPSYDFGLIKAQVCDKGQYINLIAGILTKRDPGKH